MGMNKSLRLKLSIPLIATVLATLIITILVNNAFLLDYYISGKEKTVIDVFQRINKVYSAFDRENKDQSSDSEESSDRSKTESYWGINSQNDYRLSDFMDFELSMEQISQTSNISILLYRIQNKKIINNQTVYDVNVIFSSSGNAALHSSEAENFTIYKDYINSYEGAEILSESDNYTLLQMYVTRLGSSFIYLLGRMDNGDYIMLRSSVESIQESAQISNRFFVYVMICVSCVSFLAMLFISKQFTNRITAITKIAEKMSKLDFEQKYVVSSEDELGTLGSSINRLSETLEEALGELKSANAQLQCELDQKVQIDEMRKEFLSNVSHELKTPIALIQGYAEGLQENINEDQESRDFYCEVIIDEATKMNKLVKKLLDLNQIEFGVDNVHMECFDIVEVIQNILANSDILFKQKDAKLVFDSKEPVYVWGDSYMIEEVFSNYLSNALNHLGGDRVITIEVKKTDQTVCVSVSNTGKPIPEDELDKIWIKFYKIDKARTREYGGSGVGLSIVQATMNRLGQQCGVENTADGVRFWFTLDSSDNIKEITIVDES